MFGFVVCSVLVYVSGLWMAWALGDWRGGLGYPLALFAVVALIVWGFASGFIVVGLG